MTMFRLKDCPRCGGDCYLDDGFDGPQVACIQCGYRTYASSDPMVLPAPGSGARRERMTAAVHRKEGVAA
jgi:ribosomal protein S27AE